MSEVRRGGESHFADDRWADFVRGVCGDELRSQMLQHLESGCDVCTASEAWMRAVAAVAATDRLDVPEGVVYKAREIFARRQAPSDWIEKLQAVFAQLVREIRPEWQPEGVRAAPAGFDLDAARQLRFKAGEYTIDFRMEPAASHAALEIVGQITNEGDSTEDLEGLVVQVVAPGRTIAETATNRFGEFVIESAYEKKVTLRVALKHRGQRIDLPLKDFL